MKTIFYISTFKDDEFYENVKKAYCDDDVIKILVNNNCEESCSIIQKEFDKHYPNKIIGNGLGGFYSLNFGGVEKLIINPVFDCGVAKQNNVVGYDDLFNKIVYNIDGELTSETTVVFTNEDKKSQDNISKEFAGDLNGRQVFIFPKSDIVKLKGMFI